MRWWPHLGLLHATLCEIIGIAEYIRDSRRPWRADIAVLITDPWHRNGLGSALVTYLTQLAARRGITEFDADVVLTNRPALLFVHHGWPAARATSDGGAAHFRLPLPPVETPDRRPMAGSGICTTDSDPGC